MKKTRENILKVAEGYGYNEMAFVKLIKRQGLGGAFDADLWTSYMIAITGRRDCPVCGSPQKHIIPYRKYLKETNNCECQENRYHSIALTVMSRVFSDEKERIEWIRKQE